MWILLLVIRLLCPGSINELFAPSLAKPLVIWIFAYPKYFQDSWYDYMSEVFFNGPLGLIEGQYVQSKHRNAPKALILPDCALHGAAVNRGVVSALYRALIENEFSVLRIKFTNSACAPGKHDCTNEIIEAAVALSWLESHNQPTGSVATGCIVAGFSFGAWVAMQLVMRRPEVKHYIVVAPPVTKYDFSFLFPCPVPGLIVQGNVDSVVSEDAVSRFARKLIEQKDSRTEYKVIPGADHFFRDKITLLYDEVNLYVKSKLLNGVFQHDTESFIDAKSGSDKVFLD